jgi:hypothetical protein
MKNHSLTKKEFFKKNYLKKNNNIKTLEFEFRHTQNTGKMFLTRTWDRNSRCGSESSSKEAS